MKVSMSMTVEESDEGKCFSSNIRYLEKAEITHSKMITCRDVDDYLAPYKQPQMTWYKVCLTDTPEMRASHPFFAQSYMCPVRSVSVSNGEVQLSSTIHTYGSQR